jgi:hypothetical protein
MGIFNERPLTPGQSGEQTEARFRRDELEIIKLNLAYRGERDVTMLER